MRGTEYITSNESVGATPVSIQNRIVDPEHQRKEAALIHAQHKADADKSPRFDYAKFHEQQNTK